MTGKTGYRALRIREPMKATESAALWLLVVFAIGAGPQSELKNSARQEKPRVLVQTILDTTRNAEVRSTAFRMILREAMVERQDALLLIVRQGHDQYRVEAAIILIRGGVLGVYEALAEEFTRMSADAQIRILKESQMAHLAKDARTLVESVLEKASRVSDARYADVVGIAAVLSADRSNSTCNLLRGALLNYSDMSSGLWLVMQARGCVRAQELELAKRSYTVAPKNGALRAAMACTLSAYDAAYIPSCEEPLMNIIEQYADQTPEQIVRKARESEHWREHYLEYQVDINRLGMLRWLYEPMARRIVKKGLNATNRHVRLVTLLIALQRWPDEVKELNGNSRLREEEIAAASTFLSSQRIDIPTAKTETGPNLEPQDVASILGRDVMHAFWGWTR